MSTPTEGQTWPSLVRGPVNASAAQMAQPLTIPQAHIAQLVAAPTEADFNGLLTALQNAGILASS